MTGWLSASGWIAHRALFSPVCVLYCTDRYEQEIEERQGKISKFDDALTEEQRKRKRTIDKASEKAKKHKDCKF